MVPWQSNVVNLKLDGQNRNGFSGEDIMPYDKPYEINALALNCYFRYGMYFST
jgi:hypothetical protein